MEKIYFYFFHRKVPMKDKSSIVLNDMKINAGGHSAWDVRKWSAEMLRNGRIKLTHLPLAFNFYVRCS